MAAGDRNSSGIPKDIVRHFLNDDKTKTLCGRKNWGYGSQNIDDTDCLACVKKLAADNNEKLIEANNNLRNQTLLTQ